MKEIETEQLISNLMQQVFLDVVDFPQAKRLAVQRYMRKVVRSLTRYELEFAYRFYQTNGCLEPDLAFKIEQASKGYDRFMFKRGTGGA